MNIKFSSVADVILKLLQHCSPSGRAATDHLYEPFKISIIIIKAIIIKKNLNKVTSFFVYCRISGGILA